MNYINPIAWTNPNKIDEAIEAQNKSFSLADKLNFEVWTGAWSLGTDTCGLWLDGFNDGK